jgi:protein-tyrosine phosphatase
VPNVSAFRVLMVCTANHCRSPIAQQLLQHDSAAKFGPEGAWQVDSAGTDVRAPWPMHDHARTVLAERIPEVGPHHSTDLIVEAVRNADLVLTAARQHRGVVVTMVPAAIGRTFTILQFARLCDQVEPIIGRDAGDLGRELVVQAKLARSTLQPVPLEHDDLPDPMGRGLADFRLCADRLQEAVDSILRPVELLNPVRSGAGRTAVAPAPVAPPAVAPTRATRSTASRPPAARGRRFR